LDSDKDFLNNKYDASGDNIGFIKHAMVLAFYFLLRFNKYKEEKYE
jgi:hypothetical protein